MPEKSGTDQLRLNRTRRSETAAWPRRARDLEMRYRYLSASELIRTASQNLFPGRLAVVSSFGAESAVILDLVAETDPSIPVIFLDTGQHFPETLAYRDTLVRRLGLRDVRSVAPDPLERARQDPDDRLWQNDADACCALRKVRPLERALAGFEAWITGRKRLHGFERARLPLFEQAAGRIKINPLAHWSAEQLDRAFEVRGLPEHPLVASGYPSIGCAPCTARATCPAARRSGRWAGTAKTECGIHWPR